MVINRIRQDKRPSATIVDFAQFHSLHFTSHYPIDNAFLRVSLNIYTSYELLPSSGLRPLHTTFTSRYLYHIQ